MERKIVRPEERAFNVWLDLVDQLLDKRVPLINAMYSAGEQLQEEQQRSNDTLFVRGDLWVATQEINLLLRKAPEFQARKAGWAKQSMIKDDY